MKTILPNPITGTVTMKSLLRPMSATLAALVVLLAGLVLVTPGEVQANETCAQVKLKIPQQLTFEREAFEATLGITNEQDTDALNNLYVTVEIKDANGEDASSNFYVAVRGMSNTTGVDGDGTVLPLVRAEIKWLLIPTADAGGTEGIDYYVSAQINFTTGGTEIYLTTFEERITVKPQPKLYLDYFLPRYVEGDDPFTPPVEGSVPFSLGVRVANRGFGRASRLAIDSAQVEIVENEKGALVAFRLLGAEVNNAGVRPALRVEFGDLGPGRAAQARWKMISNFLGEFRDFNVTYKHANELGGEQTSLLLGAKAHLLVGEVIVDRPGDDPYTDFLAGRFNELDNPDNLPSKIYTSDGRDLNVTVLEGVVSGRPTDANPTATVTIPPGSGWCYVRVNDPSSGSYRIESIRRPNGSYLLSPYNTWQTRWVRRRVGEGTTVYLFLHMLDYNPAGGEYLVTFRPEDPDTTPPVTELVVGDPNYSRNPVYVTSTTIMQFVAADDNPIASVEYSVDGGDYLPGLPFFLRDEGSHTVMYRSTDTRGNVEEAKSEEVIVDDSAPEILGLSSSPEPFAAGPLPDGTLRQMAFQVNAVDAVPDLSVEIEIAPGAATDSESFLALGTVATLSGESTDGEGTIPWDGRGSNNALVDEGTYTAQVTVSDPLGHSTTGYHQFTVSTLFSNEAISPFNANQTYPDLDGDLLVWQQEASGLSQIMLYNYSDDSTQVLRASANNQQRPAIRGNWVAWQESNGTDYDLYLWEIGVGDPLLVAGGEGEQTEPDLDGNWVVYQSNASGDWDIYAYNRESTETVRITDHRADQRNTVISGKTLAWNDFRWGLSEIYTYDLLARSETRVTNHPGTQIDPDLDGDTLVWADRRTNYLNLYTLDANGSIVALTSAGFDQGNPSVEGEVIVYEDFQQGPSEPDISLLYRGQVGSLSVSRAAGAQRFPKMSGLRMVWQSNQDGLWQIYGSANTVPIAAAGEDLLARVDEPTQLNGTNSFAPGGEELTYLWAFTQRPQGSTAEFEDATSATPTFTPDKSGTYIASLIVEAGGLQSVADTVTITVTLPGDIDGNGVLERADILLLLDILSGVTVNQRINLLADVNGDGKLGTAELTYLTEKLSSEEI